MTWRQHQTWTAWLDLQLDLPDRGDWYAMQVAAEVRRVLAKEPGRIKVGDFKLRFSASGQRELTDEEQAQADAMSKARWRSFLGKPTAAADGTSGTPVPRP